jgi:hypothetical protein
MADHHHRRSHQECLDELLFSLHFKYIHPIRDKYQKPMSLCQPTCSRLKRFCPGGFSENLKWIEFYLSFSYHKDDPQIWAGCVIIIYNSRLVQQGSLLTLRKGRIESCSITQFSEKIQIFRKSGTISLRLRITSARTGPSSSSSIASFLQDAQTNWRTIGISDRKSQ